VRFSYPLIFIKCQNKQSPPIDSHTTLVIHESDQVYLYNSGFREGVNLEQYIMSLYDHFVPGNCFSIQPSGWCAVGIQGQSNLCTLYALQFYFLINYYRQSTVLDLMRHNGYIRSETALGEFINQLKATIVGRVDIYDFLQWKKNNAWRKVQN